MSVSQTAQLLVNLGTTGVGSINSANTALNQLLSTSKVTAFNSSLISSELILQRIGSLTKGAMTGLGDVIKSAMDLERIKLTWEGMLGNQEEVAKRWKEIVNLSKNMPFTLMDVNQGAIQLQALGKYSERAMKAIADAASFGRKTFAETAFLSVAPMRMEFDSIERFGINKLHIAQKMGKAFKDVHANTAKEIQDIWDATVGLLEERFGGITEKVMRSASGQVTNLQDALLRAKQSMGTGMLTPVAGGIHEAITEINRMIDEGVFERIGKDMGGVLMEALHEAQALLNRIDAGKKIGGITGLLGGAGFDLHLLANNKNVSKAIQLAMGMGLVTEGSFLGDKMGPDQTFKNVFGQKIKARPQEMKIPPYLQDSLLSAAAMFADGASEDAVRDWFAAQVLNILTPPAAPKPGPMPPKKPPFPVGGQEVKESWYKPLPWIYSLGPLKPDEPGFIGPQDLYGPREDPLKGYMRVADAAQQADRLRAISATEANDLILESYDRLSTRSQMMIDASQAAMRGAITATARLTEGFLLREKVMRMKGLDIAKYVAEGGSAAALRAISAVAEKQAIAALAEGLLAEAKLFGIPTSGFKAAALFGLLAGSTAGAAGAIEKRMEKNVGKFYPDSVKESSVAEDASRNPGIRVQYAGAAPTSINYVANIIHNGGTVYGSDGLKQMLRETIPSVWRELVEAGAIPQGV